MSFFETRITLRQNQEIQDKIKALIKKRPEDFTSISHVYRVAVMRLYEYEIKKGGRDGTRRN